ncbi:MAG: PKD domain-containing protein, partial [Chitinophagaceae bacterium]|nr:PKD domain-containing protein [Chitinophagaceae bacterium]
TYIRVGNVKADVKIAFNKVGDCLSSEYRFENLSTSDNPAIQFGDSSFVWTFGDSTDPVYTGTAPLNHPYPGPGVYPITLTLTDTNFCNSPVTIDTFVRINPLVKAQFVTPAGGCAPYTAIFDNTSLAGQTFDWDFGDGSTGNQANPTHDYPTPGTYVVKLTAHDESTCNKISDTSMTITVSAKPVAGFSYTPVVPVQNKPNIFTNLSTGGVRFNWLFGDGEGLIKTSMDTALHQYNTTGAYHPCLVAINQFGCTDTTCQDIVVDILPLLDVPTAFTPGKFGRNAVVNVEGFGIGQLSWKIYNRFGQKVFETNDRRVGWDGRFNGQLQPMDVYTYTLDVIFTDGKKTRKTGDITLIR